jgi:hypothetical protein
MQRNRVRVMMAIVVLAALVGCKDQSQSAAVPVPASLPAHATRPALKSTLKVTVDGNNQNRFEVSAKGPQTITWQYDDPKFYIEFTDGKNPCSNPPDVPGGSKFTTIDTKKPYTVTCNINGTLKGGPFPYNIGPPLPTPPPPPNPRPGPPIVPTTSHCEGCVIDNLP